MFQKVKSALVNGSNRVKSATGPLMFGLVAVAGSAQAQAAAIDTSTVVGTIGTGLVAVAAIGAAWIGYRYLKKVWASL